MVCVSGATRSGKSCLAKGLADAARETLEFRRVAAPLDQDKYANRDLALRLAQEHGTNQRQKKSRLTGFEYTDSIEHDALRAAVDDAAATHELVIVEGFRAFHDAALVGRADVMLWVEIDRATCLHRRMASKKLYDFDEATSTSAHFDEHLWPRHEDYRSQTVGSTYADDARLCMLDGTRAEREVCEQALAWVRSLIGTGTIPAIRARAT